jgi:hypothetical protein
MKQLSPAKLALASVCALGLAASVSVRADTIASWSFEAGQNSALASNFSSTSTTPGSIPSDVGVGYASGSHVGTATVWSSPAGDALPGPITTLRSLSGNNWAQGSDYFQFSVSPDLAGYTYSGIGLSWDQTGSNTGPKTWGVWYSVDGTTFTQLGADYALSFFAWNTTTVAGNHETSDFSAITALNTASTMYFRIVDDSPAATGSIVGAAVGTGGTDRIDNIVITAIVTPVPEPTSLSLLGGFGLLAWTLIRRRK